MRNTLTLSFSSEREMSWFLEVKKAAEDLPMGMYGEREISEHVGLFNRAMNALRGARVEEKS